MKSSLLLTGYDEKFAPIGELTTPLMRAYAERHGMDFKCQREYPDRYPAYWQKLVDVVAAFDAGYEQVLWLDADQMITTPSITRWTPFKGFTASRDWGFDATHNVHFSMCGFIATPEARTLFEWCLANESSYAHGEFPDQKPMRELYSNALRLFRILPSFIFNSVPIEIHPTVKDPWRPGNFAAHLTMVPIERRVELFHEIKGRIGI